ncbi:dienelactone hydrolase family protein [Sulfitobacter sp. S190]|uniref:alpha/beta hydrolase family protein n=1 Tax=Sulfitobacter sp. S190 TaxID=2867022 RepID=UPI0021A66205|nr:dienelactone hydrolase [Sulfitobacter sp. S190]UWR21489.1 dienelactone hydrolase [Sulfitobacter sp. S190]
MEHHNRVDLVSPFAPTLARRGHCAVGVQTVQLTLRDQPDVAAGDLRGHDRPLTVELWYPAVAGSGTPAAYEVTLRCGVRRAALYGSAQRGATPVGAPAPVVLISHGYPGSRYLLVHLAEAFASHGFIVAAADHAGSTYDDLRDFGETLLHRPLDQMGLLDALARLEGPLGAMMQTDRCGLVGYSMGGYGALVSAGAGVNRAALDFERAPPGGMLAVHRAGSDTHAALRDPRLKAIVPIGPWGGGFGMWDADALAQIEIPALIMAGTRDDVSNYAGMRHLFDAMTGTGRHLLSFEGAGHNAAAPHPAPAEAWQFSPALGRAPFDHYADPVWDTLRMNNIAQHFAVAFLGRHLSGDTAMDRYLDGVSWSGFAEGTATGLRFETHEKGAPL